MTAPGLNILSLDKISISIASYARTRMHARKPSHESVVVFYHSNFCFREYEDGFRRRKWRTHAYSRLQVNNIMKAVSSKSLALLLCFASAPNVTADTPQPSPPTRLRNSNDRHFVNNDSSLPQTFWSWIDLANFSSLAEYEILRFEIPVIIHEDVTKRRALEEEDLLIQEDGTPEFNPDDMIVSVTFSQICKSRALSVVQKF